MGRLFAFIGMTVGGWIGWALAERFGLYAAFLLSLVGTAAGLYYGRVLARRWFG